ncbi:mitochondrial 54S ribosomal protein mL59 [Aspergillus lucknowensis]|uniref:Large ribosomal subunit protein mL59 domain-containing protein n=1 Tax=Aspergillus lucknowensis TaxID=176173 RepID=A0ABR4L5P8_9EURO
MATTQVANGSLFSKLPQRLRNFFIKYPPQIYSAAVRPDPTPASTPTPTPTETPSDSVSSSSSAPSPYTPDRDAGGYKRPGFDPNLPSRLLLYSNPEYPNPFLPRKVHRGKHWRGPKYGLRKQADLVKLAIKYNVEALLPPGPKSTEYKAARQAEKGGLQIKGTGIGQKVKGHKWERTMETRLEDRKKAMLEMPEMIRLWKQRGHGRGWKKWPKR